MSGQRARVSETLMEIRERLSPGQLLDEALRRSGTPRKKVSDRHSDGSQSYPGGRTNAAQAATRLPPSRRRSCSAPAPR